MRYEMGYASAISVVLFLVMLGSQRAVQRMLQKIGNSEGSQWQSESGRNVYLVLTGGDVLIFSFGLGAAFGYAHGLYNQPGF